VSKFRFGPVIRLKFNNGNPIPMTPEEIAAEDAENKNFKLGMTVVAIDEDAGVITVEQSTPAAECDKCYGRGWFPETVAGTENDYIPDYNERYCDCDAGKRLRVRDGAP